MMLIVMRIEGVLRQRLVLTVAMVTMVVGGLLLWLAVWVLPPHLVPPVAERAPTSTTATDSLQLENDRLKLQNDARSTLLQGLGGTVLLLGAFFTWQQLRVTREGQVTDRYTKAVDQLGNEELAVRLGGIYALQRIARDSPSDRDTIAEILCAYARTAKHKSRPSEDLQSPPLDQWAPDVQASLTILGFWRDRVGGDAQWRDFHGGDYRGANLVKAYLPYSFFYGAQLQDAQLSEVNLEHADLSRAKLHRADLRNAKLKDANLFGAELYDAKANEQTEWPEEHWEDPETRRKEGVKEEVQEVKKVKD